MRFPIKLKFHFFHKRINRSIEDQRKPFTFFFSKKPLVDKHFFSKFFERVSFRSNFDFYFVNVNDNFQNFNRKFPPRHLGYNFLLEPCDPSICLHFYFFCKQISVLDPANSFRYFIYSKINIKSTQNLKV